MADAFYISRAGVTTVEGMHRRATLTDLTTAFDLGVYGTITGHHRLRDARDLSLPVDDIVAATGT